MKKTQLTLGILFLLLLGLSGIRAQESIHTTSGNSTGSGGTVSYSVGQITFQTHVGTNGSAAQGVQQPYEISILTGIQATEVDLPIVLAYPNPANEFLQLEVEGDVLQDLSFKLTDLTGQILQNEKIIHHQTRIVMINYVPATYFVSVMKSNNEVKVFKIIKN